MTTWTGGCLCGAIRYESTRAPLSAGTCHCRDCQQWTGTAFHAIVGFPVDGFRYTRGQPKKFRAPSGIKELGFCPDCGSPIWDRYLYRIGEDDAFGTDTVWIPVGTLDDPKAVRPEFHYGVETQLPWVRFEDDLPRVRCDEEPLLQEALAKAGRKS